MVAMVVLAQVQHDCDKIFWLRAKVLIARDPWLKAKGEGCGRARHALEPKWLKPKWLEPTRWKHREKGL